MKIHFAEVEKGNESNPYDEWEEPLCKTYSEKVDNDWNIVDCKRCLKHRSQYELEKTIAMEQNCVDMEEFVQYMKDKEEI